MPVAAPPRPRAPAGRSERPSRSPGGRRPPEGGRIHWNRLGRRALLLLLAVVLALYIAPLNAWVTQSAAAEEQRRELRALEREHERLTERARELGRSAALEREARKLGMVRRGERAFVIQKRAARR